MARLHEYQGKALLQANGLAVPRGQVARTVAEAADAARAIGGRVILKVQAWITGRKTRGGVVFAESPDEAAAHAERLLAMKFGNFPVSEVLVEEAIDIVHEVFCSFTIDDAAMAPVLLLDCHGGSGIEDRAATVARVAIDVKHGVDRERVREILRGSPIEAGHHDAIAAAIDRLFEIARACEARSLEVNPLVVVRSGAVMAADCRITIDDYAVFRHPELGIEIARELDHPATGLERIAYDIEQRDHRGTFYFAQLPTAEIGPAGLIGFHGAGGGGSMMSMDAATREGFTLANFCDTSGNPSAAKVYSAARIILAQEGLVGYFGSGSGVASQEQYHSAYGLAKAFLETSMDVPVVVRLGGNSEDRAVEILQDACRDLPAVIEGYRKDDTPAACAERFHTLVRESGGREAGARRVVPAFVGAASSYSFPIEAGRVWIDHEHCDAKAAALVVEHGAGLLALDDAGRPVLAVAEADVATRDSELIALEIECHRAGYPVVFVDLPFRDWMAGDGAGKRRSDEATERRRGGARCGGVSRGARLVAIIIDQTRRVLVQGITGREGRARSRLMLGYGTTIVAGCTPGKGGEEVEGVPVFDTVADATSAVGDIDISVIFVPARLVKDAAIEAIEAGVGLLVLVPDRVPLWDAMEIAAAARAGGASFVGPNTLGVLSPGKAVLGMIGGRAESARQWFNEPIPGRTVGVVSRSGGMTSSCGYYLSRAGVGLSTLVHVGGDSIIGLPIPDIALRFEADEETDAIVVFGEIGGSQEERLAEHVRQGRVTKPVIAYIGGAAAREGTRFSHAGAIIEGGRGTHAGKVEALCAAGATVVAGFGDLPAAAVEVFARQGATA